MFTVVEESAESVTLTTSCLTMLYAPFRSQPARVLWVNPPSSPEAGRRCMGGVPDVLFEREGPAEGVFHCPLKLQESR